jgi:hypothetical protein
MIHPDGSHAVAYDYFAGLFGRSVLRAGLRTADGAHYVSANNEGGGAMFVNAPWIRDWEQLKIIGPSTGGPFTGDLVNILTHNGHYLTAQNGGGSGTDSTATAAGAAQQFALLKQNAGASAIADGDTVALQASS